MCFCSVSCCVTAVWEYRWRHSVIVSCCWYSLSSWLHQFSVRLLFIFIALLVWLLVVWWGSKKPQKIPLKRMYSSGIPSAVQKIKLCGRRGLIWLLSLLSKFVCFRIVQWNNIVTHFFLTGMPSLLFLLGRCSIPPSVLLSSSGSDGHVRLGVDFPSAPIE